MTAKQLHRLTVRAYKASKAFRHAAIDASAAFQTYAPDRPNRAVRRLRDVAEMTTGFALDAMVESAPEKK